MITLKIFVAASLKNTGYRLTRPESTQALSPLLPNRFLLGKTLSADLEDEI